MITQSYLSIDVPLEQIRYRIEDNQGFQRIILEDGITFGSPGAPELPGIIHIFCLPHNQNIMEVSVVYERWEQISGNFKIYPVQSPQIIGEPPEFTRPDSTIYNSCNYYPQSCIIEFHSGNLRGYRIGQIFISPFRYNPGLSHLEVLKALKIRIKISYSPLGISPRRQTQLSRMVFKKFVSSITGTPDEVIEPSFGIEENPEDLSPTELPSLSGPPVDLLIITTEQLIPGYEEFARLKKLLGFNTAIKSTNWIREHYTGVDDAERIRNFIREAVEKWGTSFVLLGNDVPDIPTRWVWLEYLMGLFPAHIATDLYFSDLDGNWNYDGDDRFGELPDSIDFYPDVFVGRIPAHSLEDISGYLNKLRFYIFEPHCPPSGEPPYQRKALFVCSKLHYENDAYYMALSLAGRLPANFLKHFLNEQSWIDFKNGIYHGYNLITFIAHGDVNKMRVRTIPDEYITNFHYDSLTNVINPLMVVITCYAGPFQEDCLGEHWVMNTQGGGLGFIGPTSSSIASYHLDYINYLFDSLFSLPLGPALSYSKIPLIPPSQLSDNWHRIYQFSLNLLGDPTLRLWNGFPSLIDSVVFPETINLGIDTLVIQVNPPLDSFLLILYKENELFSKNTGHWGIAQAAVKTRSCGYLKFTITSPDYFPYIDSLYVIPSASHLVYNNYTIIDTSGNGNGIINPGEEIFLKIYLQNNGGLPATDVFLSVSTSDSFITFINDTTSYPVINPNCVEENLTPLSFFTRNTISDEHSIDFVLTINYSGMNNLDTFQIIAQAPKISLFTQKYFPLVNQYLVLPYVENRGHHFADSVVARISAYSDTILVLDSTATFPPVLPNSITSARDSFGILLNHPAGQLVYNFRLYYRGIKVEDRKIKLDSLMAPDSLVSFGMPNSILLKWKPVDGAIGYRIFRALNQNGPYQFLNNSLEPICYFEDTDMQSALDYYYYLYGVDSSMNEGINSDTICAKINPRVAQGWPKTVYGYLFSSPNFGDLDPSYPGLEIVVGSLDGSIYLWHYDGTPFTGNDGRIFQGYGEIWSSPAVGDVNNDGTLEICFGIRRPQNNFYILTRNDTIWEPLSGWPKSLSGGVLTSPALADIDGDGDLEIFVISEGAKLYAFQHNGAGLYSPDGLLKNLYGWHSGSPAIGDIDDDGDLEIVACGGGDSDSLFVWDDNGNYHPPFPIAVSRGMLYSPVLGDIIGNSNLEICFYTDSTQSVNVVDANGALLWQNYIPNLGDVEASPILANIVGNERPEVICGNNKGLQVLMVFDSLGNAVPGFPPIFGHDYKLPIASDIDGDSVMEILCGAADWNLYGINNDGSLTVGFPIHFGIRIEQSPAVFDIDLDGKLELMVGAHDFKFWVFNLNSEIYEWPKFRYDSYNSGCYKSCFWAIIKQRIVKEDKSQFSFSIFPNPFLNHLVIHYALGSNDRVVRSQKSVVNLKIYDITGRVVKSFNLSPRTSLLPTSVVWDGRDDLGRRLPSSVYFVRLEIGDFKKVKKAILLR